MARFKVRHLIEKPSGFYFQATPKMRQSGIFSESLGPDLVGAIARAEALNASWDAIRKGEDRSLQDAPRRGTVAWLIVELRNSAEWRDKAPATIDEIEYAFGIIEPVFGPTALRRVTPRDCTVFYATLREQGSIHRAARIFKWLRYLLNFAIRQGFLVSNSAAAVRVKRPPPRMQVWTPNQITIAIKAAKEEGLHAVAVALSIAYDTSLRPVDIRSLTSGQVKADRLEIVQAKTGRPVHLPLWPETIEAIRDYQVNLGAVPLATTPLLRTPRGRPYTKNYLAKQVRKVLRIAGIPDDVQLRDIRRTASKERAEAGATEAELAAGTGHSIERGSQILDVYNPRSYSLAKSAQDKRRQHGDEAE